MKLKQMLVACLIFLAAAVAVTALTTDKQEYELGDVVKVSSGNLPGNRLVISTGETSYQFLGDLRTETQFIPQSTGEHAIQLVDREGNELERTNFTVAKQQDKKPLSMQLEKSSYEINEMVTVNILGEIRQEHRLQLSTPTANYLFVLLSNRPRFVPNEPGEHNLSLWESGELIATETFDVAEKAKQMEAKTAAAAGKQAAIAAQSAGNPVITPEKRHFKLGERPTFRIETEEKGSSALTTAAAQTAVNRLETGGETITAIVTDAAGQLADVDAEIRKEASGEVTIQLAQQRSFRPGKYVLQVELRKEGEVFVQQQDFTWGVLAINVNKSAYLPNEDAFIGMAVLDDEGHPVCDADVKLIIKAPNNAVTTLTTANNEIRISEECEFLGVTKLPDYYTTYSVRGVGTYAMNLTAVTENGERSVIDQFSVRNSVQYDVARNGPTRIFPLEPYTMKLTINANRDHSGPIREFVPASFEITPQEGLTVTTAGQEKILQWEANAASGETLQLSYEFDAPDVSPEFYLLGPLEIGAWQEERQWQIASDIVAAGEKEEVLLRAQGCNLEDDTLTAQTFSSACAGTYPSTTCGTNDDRLSCDDSVEESTRPSNNNWGGANITAFNSTIANCDEIQSVRVCHDWRQAASFTAASCRIGTHNGDLAWTTNSVTCPTTEASGVTCTDVTANEPWTCDDFFSSTGPAGAMIELTRSQGGQPQNLLFDVLYFNVTYLSDTQAPNNTIIEPLQSANISGSFLVNASINDSRTVIRANLTVYNHTGNATGYVMMTLGAGTTTTGYWNATLDSLNFPDGKYNLSVNATDDAANQNAGLSINLTVTLDNTAPNATIVTPVNVTNTTTDFLINASVNDSASGVFNATFMLFNNTHNVTEWIFAELGAGTISSGYWNTTATISSLNDGTYNITANATDYAGNQIVTNISKFAIDRDLPNATAIQPRNASNFTFDFLINASVNDSLSGVFNVTFQLVGKLGESSVVSATMGTGNIYAGYWNSTIDVAAINDDRYNITANITDFAGNYGLVNLSSVNVDRTAANISAETPVAVSNFSGNFLVNASVNDSVSEVFNATFRLTTAAGDQITEWLYAELNSGTITAGFWNATAQITALNDGTYNITANATDYAGNQQLENITTAVIDRIFPNATITTPLNNTNTTSDFLINASVNDSTTGIFNSTFRLTTASGDQITEWLYAELNSGTISSGYWNTTVITATVSDGHYNITVNATDFAGNQKLVNVSHVAIDRVTPNVTAIQPVNASNFTSDFLINVSANDSVSGVFNVSFQLVGLLGTGDVVPATIGAGDISAGYWNATIDATAVNDGRYNVTANASDFAGNYGLANISDIRIDRTAANISAETPAAVSNFSNDFLINASVNDSVSTVFNATFRLTTSDGSTVTEWLYAELNSGDAAVGWWNATASVASLPDDLYNITANATDFAGNQRIVNISQVLIDREDLNTSIIEPFNGSQISGTALFNSSVNDTDSGVRSVEYRVINDTTTSDWVEATLNSGTIKAGYWSAEFNTFLVQNGNYNITISATDFAGNQRVSNISNVSINNIIDEIAPNSTIIVPSNNANISGSFIVNASINDTLGSVIAANATLFNHTANVTGPVIMTLGAGTAANGYWNTTLNSLNFPDGKYNLSVNSSDASHNGNISENVTITIDNTLPNASIVEPVNGTIFTSEEFLINASANDTLTQVFNASFRIISPSTATAWIYAELNSGTIAAGYWNATFASTDVPTGTYNITINATDFANNQLLSNISQVQIDRNAPNVSAITPLNSTNTTEGFLINASVNDSVSEVFNATFRLTTAAGDQITEWLYAELATGSNLVGFWNATAQVDALNDGHYNITINATDNAENQNVANISNVKLDRAAPNATISAPLNNTNHSSDFLINASVNDSISKVFNATFRLTTAAGDQITEWLYAEINSGTIAAGYWNATASITSLNDGFYNITVNATDFAGNQNIINITEVGIDRAAPNATIVVPLNDTNITADFLINASVNDSVTGVFNATFMLFNNTHNVTEWLYAELNSGHWNTTVTIAELNDGFYNITINATDYANNQLLANISKIAIDRNNANASIVVPLNDTNITADFLINASVNDSVTGVFNATFMLFNNTHNVTEWLYAERVSGSAGQGYWNATTAISSLSDGFYNITINATDYANNQLLANISKIAIDRNNANASIVAPLNNTNTTTDFVVNISANDSVSKVFNVSFKLGNADGSQNSGWQHANLSTGDSGQGYWNGTFSVSGINDGHYNITVNATDFAGNQNVLNGSNVRIDRASPNATMVVPSNGSEQVGEMLINASVNDSVSSVETVRYRLSTADGITLTNWIAATIGNGNSANGYWNATFDTTTVGDNEYNITVEATDYAGNQRVENISTIEVVNNDNTAAGENENAFLRAQACNLEDSTTAKTFSLACSGTYPADCPSDALSCNDGTAETSDARQDEFGGANITAFNDTISDCVSIKTVRLCYEWSLPSTQTYTSCTVGTDKAGDLSWASTGITCPTTTADIVRCEDITSLETSWACGDFFNRDTPAVWAYIEGLRTSSGGGSLLTMDAFYFNVTYTRDITAPDAAIIGPLNNSNISGSFLANASVNDTTEVAKVNLTVFNNTGNATGLIPMTLGAGTVTTGWWNATLDSTKLSDGSYNLSVNATDGSGNIRISDNISVTIDNTGPNATIMTPINNTAFAALNVSINASVNDSLTGIFNASFRFANASSAMQWHYATINSGGINIGYWNATITVTELASGQYNITINATDFAGNQILANISLINISRADLAVNSSGIVFVNGSPAEEQNVTINATIHNRGLTEAAGVLVEFFNESISDGNRISNATVEGLPAGASVIVNTTYIAKIGPNNIFVRVDGNNSHSEDNETNNQANSTLHVSGYSFYYGNFTSITLLATAGNSTLRQWGLTNGTGNVYVADEDSSVDFTALQALNRTIARDAAADDYAEADRILNMTNFTDSITRIYTNDNGLTPHTVITITAFGSEIAEIPATNSTNSSNFLTGILWDTSDDSGNSEFDDTDREDLIFVTEATEARNGRYGVYTAEARVPANLKKYVQPNTLDSVAFYTELT